MDNTSFSTQAELNFIKHLSSGKWHDPKKKVSQIKRDESLRRYIKAAEVRERWGDINGTKAIAYAKNELVRETSTNHVSK